MKGLRILPAGMLILFLLSACSVADPLAQIADLDGLSEVTTTDIDTADNTEATVEEEKDTSTNTEAASTSTETTPVTEPETASATEPSAPSNAGGVNPTTQVISSGNGYQIIRADHSYRNGAGQVLISHYYDYVALTGAFPGAQKINARLKQIADAFFWSEEELKENAASPWLDPKDPFFYTMSSRVTYISDKCLCVTVDMEWFMGGVHNAGSDGYVFDLQTGEKATLVSLAGGDPASLEAQLKEIVWEQINNDPYETPWEDSHDKLSAYTLDTFNYSIENGQIVLYFAEYEFFSGAHGPVTVYTGIYI